MPVARFARDLAIAAVWAPHVVQTRYLASESGSTARPDQIRAAEETFAHDTPGTRFLRLKENGVEFDNR